MDLLVRLIELYAPTSHARAISIVSAWLAGERGNLNGKMFEPPEFEAPADETTK